MTGPADRRKQQRPVAGDPDAMAALNAELRETVREAHAALKDFDRVLREYRAAAATTLADVRLAAAAVAEAELHHYGDHLQAEMNAQARNLNRAVAIARDHIVSQLTLAYLEADPDVRGRLRFVFSAPPFDEDPRGDGPPPETEPDATGLTGPTDEGESGRWTWPLVADALSELTGSPGGFAMVILPDPPGGQPGTQPEETPE